MTATASTPAPASETLHVELVQQHAGGGEQARAAGDLTLTTSAPSLSATAPLTLHAAAIAIDCGDRLIVRVSHPAGAQPLIAVVLTLDIP